MSENKIEFITRNNLIDEVKIPLKVIMHKAKHVYTEDNVKEFLEFSSTCLSLINKGIKFNFIVYAFRSTHFDSFNKLVVTLTLFHNDDVYSIRMESSKDTNTMLVFDSTGIYTEGNDSLISIKRLTNDERRKYIIYHSLYSNPNLYIIPPFTRTSSLVFISDKKYTIKITLFNGTNELCVLNSLCNIAEELVKNGYNIFYWRKEKECDFIVEKSIEHKLGARGLRSIVESVLMDAMFELPSKKSTKKLHITRAYAEDKFSKAGLSKLKAAV